MARLRTEDSTVAPVVEYSREDYAKGVARHDVEYGAEFPDGTREWSNSSFGTEGARIKYLDYRARELKNHGLPDSDFFRPVFLTRVARITYSIPEVLK